MTTPMTNDNELRALPELPAGVSEVRVVYADGVRTRLPYDPIYTAEQMREYARAALAAAPAGGEVDAWRPIETAPKDAACLLLGNANGVWVGRHVSRYASGYKPPQPWHTLMLNHGHIGPHEYSPPTHWMPLPTPPAPSGEVK